jgi:hypothetical protein
MVSQDLGVRTNAPSRATVASWVVTALQDLPEIMVKNSWRHMPFEYFGGDETENDEETHEGVQYYNEATTKSST